MLKERYCDMFDKVKADERLIADTLHAAKGGRKKITVKWMGVAAAACAVCMLASVPVLAENVPAFYHTLYRISPQTAELFKPLEMISESNGVRMEVGGIYFHENIVEAYITMQDLEEDRLDLGENFCSVSLLETSPAVIERTGATIQKHELRYAGYEAETKTLTLLLSIEFITGELRPGDEVTLDLDRILGNGVKWEGELDMIHWLPTDVNAEFCGNGEMFIYGGVAEEIREAYPLDEAMLRPYDDQALAAQDVTFTGAAYQDGLLHTQLYIEGLKLNNDGVIWLEKSDGTQVYSIAELSGCEDRAQMGNLAACWKEFVFAIDEEELAECTLHGSFQRFTNMIEGDWRVTFTLPESS